MGASSFEIGSFRRLPPLASGTPSLCDTHCCSLLLYILSKILFLSATHVWLIALVASDYIHLNLALLLAGCVYLWAR